MQIEEQHGQGFAVRLLEKRQEIRTAQERQGRRSRFSTFTAITGTKARPQITISAACVLFTPESKR